MVSKSRYALPVIVCAAIVATASIAADRQTKPISPNKAVEAVEEKVTVKVRGVLQNAGTNFFNDRRLIIADPAQANPAKSRNAPGKRAQELFVQPWAPLNVARPRNLTDKSSQPLSMSDYMGQEIVVTGRIVTRNVKNVGLAKVLIADKVEFVTK